MGKTKENNLEIKLSNQNNLRKLEQFYVNGKIDDMMQEIENQKQKLCSDIVAYADRHLKPCKWDENGNPTEFKIVFNPLVVNNYFFKSIVPLGSVEPMYNAEKLALVFEYYCYVLAEVNDKIGNFPSSLTSFCKLAGITLSTLRTYKNSSDLNMRIIVEKIYDQIGDENITLSQMGMVKEKTTIFKMKAQNEIIEKEQPKVSINIVEKPDMDRINARINNYKHYATKKDK